MQLFPKFYRKFINQKVTLSYARKTYELEQIQKRFAI